MNTEKLRSWIITTIREAAWAPVSVVVFYLVGFVSGWFNVFPPLDIPTHFMGGVAITYFYRSAIRSSQRFLGDIPFAIQVILAITAAGTTTVLWEFGEYISDYLLRTHHVFGLNDTLKDMFFGLLGATVLSLLYKKR